MVEVSSHLRKIMRGHIEKAAASARWGPAYVSHILLNRCDNGGPIVMPLWRRGAYEIDYGTCRKVSIFYGHPASCWYCGKSVDREILSFGVRGSRDYPGMALWACSSSMTSAGECGASDYYTPLSVAAELITGAYVTANREELKHLIDAGKVKLPQNT